MTLCYALNGYSQNWYDKTTTITVGQTTLSIEVFDKDNILIYNAKNTRDNGKLYYKDGSEVSNPENYGASAAVISQNNFYLAIAETFTDAELAVLGKPVKMSPMSIYYVVGSDGSTLEVAFILRAWILPAVRTISPAKFATLEENLKKYMRFTVNYAGQQLQYFGVEQFVRFDKMYIPATIGTNDPPIENPIELPPPTRP